MTNIQQGINEQLKAANAHLESGFYFLRQRQVLYARDEANEALEIYAYMRLLLKGQVPISRFSFTSESATQDLEGLLHTSQRGVSGGCLAYRRNI